MRAAGTAEQPVSVVALPEFDREPRTHDIPVGTVALLKHRARTLVAALRWDELDRALAAHPVFNRCTREEVRRVARSGDEIRVQAGQVLLREESIGYWFVVVLEGELAVARRGRNIGTLGPRDHVGDVAILGLGPQPATVTSSVSARLFVLSRRDLVSLAYAIPGLQAGLATPDDARAGLPFDARVRAMREEGLAAWKHIKRAAPSAPTLPSWLTGGVRAVDATEPAWGHIPAEARPGIAGRGQGVSFARLAAGAFRKRTSEQHEAARVPMPRWAVLAGTSLACATAAVASFTFHPPVLVVRPGEPIDITADITVDGAPVHPPSGRYILTPVEIEHPPLAGTVLAAATGATMVPAPPEAVLVAPAAADDPEFTASQARAVELATRRAGLDPGALRVTFRPREISGPSAALVYALALTDLLEPGDLTAGRTVAATGTLDESGRVGDVGFGNLKVTSARTARAAVFVVASHQRDLPAATPGLETVRVDTLDDAVEALRRPRELGPS